MPVSKHTGKMYGTEWIKQRNKRSVAKIRASKIVDTVEIPTESIKQEVTTQPPAKTGFFKRVVNRLKNK